MNSTLITARDPEDPFFYTRNDGPVVFATNETPGSTEQFSLLGLQKGDRVYVAVNDGDTSNNGEGFTVTIFYYYLSCGPRAP